MNRVLGRTIYIVDLDAAVNGAGGPESFAQRCKDCKFRSVWIRLGHAQDLDVNFTLANFDDVQKALTNVGIALWGWHVPQCPDIASAVIEANLVNQNAADKKLAGVLMDAEQNDPKIPKEKWHYFLGGPDEANKYASMIRAACQKTGVGLAFSGNDQPPEHDGFPFDAFLKYTIDNCPQVYYGETTPTARMSLSVKGYQPLEAGRNFKDRFKPVGNITTSDDVALPDEDTCDAYFKQFLGLVNTGGYKAYGLWCWDDAGPKIFDTLRNTPEFLS